jgi:GNAT superfamily N-acetyltransferase
VVVAVTNSSAGEPYGKIAMKMSLNTGCSRFDPAVQGDGVGPAVARQVIEHAQSLADIRAISITSATFMERAHVLYESLGFQRAPERDWCVPGEDVLLWAFRLEL